jgi:hypothetical protein
MIEVTEWKLVIDETCNRTLFLVIEIQKNAITSFVSVIWVSQGRSITSFRLRVSPKLVIWVRDKEWPNSTLELSFSFLQVEACVVLNFKFNFRTYLA